VLFNGGIKMKEKNIKKRSKPNPVKLKKKYYLGFNCRVGLEDEKKNFLRWLLFGIIF
jgi:hypothetical protein